MNLSQKVRAFVGAAEASYAARVTDPEGMRSTREIFARLGQGALIPDENVQPERFAVCDWLGKVTVPAGDLDDVLRAFRALETHLRWYRRDCAASRALPGFADAHANAMVVGRGGLVPHDRVTLGLSLIAPGTRYPDHDHPPEETYLSLSDGEFFHGESDWFTPGVGGTFHNTPGMLHAMRSGKGPLCAIWALQS
ncbi:dimethylsulfoniopropionate lyase [Roseovarius sp. LXJ103]|uniref:dimethylsulfonioproprionate lyase family protein n=1 Tax=Roseovarius carneus TaxID=2853164 RepID=UPI0015E823D0|nr:dimethylsulfonioproprionate lyase family protein [Roseovarius carneus]MBZ8119048.1 dimethylsulfoniopropionate lyase [Roseovarius carneus]